ncbi:MAG TPA: hydrogenase iron-sulfur subunit [Bacillota bacterium]|nr:hydrogenase iron-sulfur subunit [Bacillota bacterium]
MKTGLFISRCEGALEEVLNLGELAVAFSSDALPLIVDSFYNSTDIAKMVKLVGEYQLDSVVLAGNSDNQHKTTRQGELLVELLEQEGINPNRIATVNIKEHLSYVHMQGKPAQRKAEALIRVALAKVRMAGDIEVVSIIPRKAVAVLGLNEEAYFTAERLLYRDFRVYLIGMGEQEADLNSAPNSKAKAVTAYVDLHPKAKILSNCQVSDLFGWPGEFTLQLVQGDTPVTLDVGAILVADNTSAELVSQLRPILHLGTGEDGLFTSVAADTLPVNSIEEGIFIIPPNMPDVLSIRVSLADSAALAIINYLEQPEIIHNNVISEVNAAKCGGCGTCVKTCSFKASSIDADRISRIDPKRCKGCGNCVTACPTGARDLLTYPQRYLLEAIKILGAADLEKDKKVLALLCEGCGIKAFDRSGERRDTYPESILPLGVRCGGNIDTQLIMEAFVHGFDGVVICKCDEEHCLNIVGNADLDRRANLFREILRSRGIDDDLLRIVETTPGDEGQCISSARELYDIICGKGGIADEQ